MSLPINARPLMVLRLATSATREVGATSQGTLTIFPVIGGSFEGERLRGQVLARRRRLGNSTRGRHLHA